MLGRKSALWASLALGKCVYFLEGRDPGLYPHSLEQCLAQQRLPSILWRSGKGSNLPLLVLRVSRVPPPRRSSGLPRRAMPASSTIHVLQLLRELLAFVLLSYTVLIGALLLAGWTTYFLVLK